MIQVPIICSRRWALEHGAREHQPRSSQFSRRDATSRVRELRDVSCHVAYPCDSVRKEQTQHAVFTVSVDVHVPKTWN